MCWYVFYDATADGASSIWYFAVWRWAFLINSKSLLKNMHACTATVQMNIIYVNGKKHYLKLSMVLFSGISAMSVSFCFKDHCGRNYRTFIYLEMSQNRL